MYCLWDFKCKRELTLFGRLLQKLHLEIMYNRTYVWVQKILNRSFAHIETIAIRLYMNLEFLPFYGFIILH